MSSVCPICKSRNITFLEPIKINRSLISNGLVENTALKKSQCLNCGCAFSNDNKSSDELTEFYKQEYNLLSEHPDAYSFNRSLYDSYAKWVIETLPDNYRPTNLLEIGAGQGWLLRSLENRLPETKMTGIELQESACISAQKYGQDVRNIDLNNFSLNKEKFDIVISLNVLEHVPDQVNFLKQMSECLKEDGIMIIIIPNGEIPHYELLFKDHLFSHTINSFSRVCEDAGLAIETRTLSPHHNQQFQLISCIKDKGTNSISPRDDSKICQARDIYIQEWNSLDKYLLSQQDNNQKNYCFGAGEWSYLINAYCPETWGNIEACVIDASPGIHTSGIKIISYETLEQQSNILLAISPFSQDMINRRLSNDGHKTIKWNDIVAR